MSATVITDSTGEQIRHLTYRAFGEQAENTGPGPSTVPEPSTLLLEGLGVLGIVGWRTWRKKRQIAKNLLPGIGG